MKIFLFVLTFVLGSLSSLSAQGLEIESDEGKFSVKLPEGFENPEVSIDSIAIGDSLWSIMTMYISTSTTDNVILVSYNDYPDFVFEQDNQKVMMDNLRDGALEKMNGKLEKQKDFTFQGHPARSMNFSLDMEGQEGYGRLDCFVIKPRLYQIMYIGGSKQERESESIKAIFSSFKVLP